MKKLFAGLVTLCISLSFTAQAITIDLIPSQSHTNLGDNIEVEVRISGLTDSNAPSLGAYDVNFNYDASIFSFNTITWGDSVLGNQLDLMGFGTLQDTNDGIGWLNVLELSFDDALDLDLLQAGEFTLFSVLLDAIAAGSGDFSLTANTLGDAYGNDLSIDAINGTRVNVGSVSVPEPSSLLLFSMLVIAAFRIRALQLQ